MFEKNSFQGKKVTNIHDILYPLAVVFMMSSMIFMWYPWTLTIFMKHDIHEFPWHIYDYQISVIREMRVFSWYLWVTRFKYPRSWYSWIPMLYMNREAPWYPQPHVMNSDIHGPRSWYPWVRVAMGHGLSHKQNVHRNLWMLDFHDLKNLTKTYCLVKQDIQSCAKFFDVVIIRGFAMVGRACEHMIFVA